MFIVHMQPNGHFRHLRKDLKIISFGRKRERESYPVWRDHGKIGDVFSLRKMDL